VRASTLFFIKGVQRVFLNAGLSTAEQAMSPVIVQQQCLLYSKQFHSQKNSLYGTYSSFTLCEKVCRFFEQVLL
jgi:hypothetical protein